MAVGVQVSFTGCGLLGLARLAGRSLRVELSVYVTVRVTHSRPTADARTTERPRLRAWPYARLPPRDRVQETAALRFQGFLCAKVGTLQDWPVIRCRPLVEGVQSARRVPRMARARHTSSKGRLMRSKVRKMHQKSGGYLARVSIWGPERHGPIVVERG